MQNSIHSTTQYIKADHHRFAYRVIGEGRPVLFLQRFRGTMDDWDPAFVDRVAQHNKVYLFDNVGIGLTDGNTPSTITAIADDAVQFAKAIGLTKFNVLGWSLGGIVAQVLTLRHQELVDRLILVGTGPAASKETVYPTQRFLEIARKEVNTEDDHQVLFFTEDDKGWQHTRDSLARISRRGDLIPAAKTENWMSQSLAMRDFYSSPQDYFNQLKNINVPTLVSGARYDIAFPMVNSYLLAREIVNSTLLIYPEAGHAFHHQLHDTFGDVVNGFLGR